MGNTQNVKYTGRGNTTREGKILIRIFYMENYSRREMMLKWKVIGGKKVKEGNPRKINILGKIKTIGKRNLWNG